MSEPVRWRRSQARVNLSLVRREACSKDRGIMRVFILLLSALAVAATGGLLLWKVRRYCTP